MGEIQYVYNYTIDNILLNYITEASDLVAFSPSSKCSLDSSLVNVL